MNTFRITVTSQTDVVINGKELNLKPSVYKVDKLEFCKDNDFIQCNSCKDWFDESMELGEYHNKAVQGKQKTYCEECFKKKYE